MLRIVIPGRQALELNHLVCDFNGTLAVDGVIASDVVERLAQLAPQIDLHVLTAGTHGNLDRAQALLAGAYAATGAASPAWRLVGAGEEKAAYVRQLGATSVVAIGNGANDVLMLRTAALGIAIVGAEGLALAAAQAAQVIAPSPQAALDLLLHPLRLVATLRG